MNVIPVLITPLLCLPVCAGAVRGVLAYVGFAGILSTELFQRLVCVFRPLPDRLLLPSLTPDLQSSTVSMPFWRVHCFTLMQVRRPPLDEGDSDRLS